MVNGGKYINIRPPVLRLKSSTQNGGGFRYILVPQQSRSKILQSCTQMLEYSIV